MLMESSEGLQLDIPQIVKEHLEYFERRLTRELTKKFTERKLSFAGNAR